MPVSANVVMGLIALVLLALGVALTGVGVWVVLKRYDPADTRAVQVIDEALRRLGRSAEHHVTVNAVLALTKQFESNPDLLANLSSYSREVVGAALLHRVNALGADVKVAQDRLSYYRKQVVGGQRGYDELIRQCESMLESLQAELNAANAAVQAFNRPRAVS